MQTGSRTPPAEAFAASQQPNRCFCETSDFAESLGGSVISKFKPSSQIT